MTTAQSISSIGRIVCDLQRPFGVVRKAIEQAGIKPAVTINHVAHYSDDDVELIRQQLDSKRESK